MADKPRGDCDEDRYAFVEDGFQRLCVEGGIVMKAERLVVIALLQVYVGQQAGQLAQVNILQLNDGMHPPLDKILSAWLISDEASHCSSDVRGNRGEGQT